MSVVTGAYGGAVGVVCAIAEAAKAADTANIAIIFFIFFLPFGGDIRRETARRVIRGRNSTTQGRHAHFPLAKQAIDFWSILPQAILTDKKATTWRLFDFNQNVVLLQRDCR
jgi:hypothetical protein